MCGIAGFIDFKGSKIDITLLKQVTDAIFTEVQMEKGTG